MRSVATATHTAALTTTLDEIGGIVAGGEGAGDRVSRSEIRRRVRHAVSQRVRFRILLVEFSEDVQRRMRQLQTGPRGRRGPGATDDPGIP